MTINQLFRKQPSREHIQPILEMYGLSGLDDTKSFTKKELISIETVNNINQHKGLLEEIYLPCKAKIYLKDLNEKKCITILRQLLRLFNYSLKSIEKYIQSEKMIEYTIHCNFKKEESNMEEKCIISFD